MHAAADLDYLRALFGLSGRVALVTGARQGIGRGIAHAFARVGAAIVSTSRNGASLGALAAELDELGAQHIELELDVTDPAQVDDVVHTAALGWGRLDIVVNNAGIPVRSEVAELSVEEWDAVFAANLRGAFLVSRAAIREMSDRGGRIINLSSTYAAVAVRRQAAYAASKAGLEQFTRVLALEAAPRGITVNALAPTTVVTESRRAAFAGETARRERTSHIPLGRLGEPDDIVGAALLLAGDAGRFITGTTILVDGGYTLGPESSG